MAIQPISLILSPSKCRYIHVIIQTHLFFYSANLYCMLIFCSRLMMVQGIRRSIRQSLLMSIRLKIVIMIALVLMTVNLRVTSRP